MLRFVPDHWLDGLLRPLLLADPVVGLYVETHAPDWRYAALTLLLLLALATQRRLTILQAWQWRLLLGSVASFYLWTFVSGNGRYFIWALLLVGPFAVLAAMRLKASMTMRNTVILGVLAVQAWSVDMTYRINVWAIRPWIQGPGLALAETPLRHKPAVFITIGSISHSILVPQMHPESRWSNVAGQHDFMPGTQDHAKYVSLMSSPLPKYAVVRAAKLAMASDLQPSPQARVVITRALARAGLTATTAECSFVRSDIGGMDYTLEGEPPPDNGFWFCPVRHDAAAQTPLNGPYAPELDDVFQAVEEACPRLFPAGNATTRPHDDGASRLYSQSDTVVIVTHAGEVALKNLRAINPTRIGTVAEVRERRFKFDCNRLPGRYAPPWSRNSEGAVQ